MYLTCFWYDSNLEERTRTWTCGAQSRPSIWACLPIYKMSLPRTLVLSRDFWRLPSRYKFSLGSGHTIAWPWKGAVSNLPFNLLSVEQERGPIWVMRQKFYSPKVLSVHSSLHDKARKKFTSAFAGRSHIFFRLRRCWDCFLEQLSNCTTHQFLNNQEEKMFHTELFFEDQKFKADVLNPSWCFVVNIVIVLSNEKNLCKDNEVRKKQEQKHVCFLLIRPRLSIQASTWKSCISQCWVDNNVWTQ